MQWPRAEVPNKKCDDRWVPSPPGSGLFLDCRQLGRPFPSSCVPQCNPANPQLPKPLDVVEHVHICREASAVSRFYDNWRVSSQVARGRSYTPDLTFAPFPPTRSQLRSKRRLNGLTAASPRRSGKWTRCTMLPLRRCPSKPLVFLCSIV